MLPWCARHQVTLVAYSPFGAGRFPSSRTARGRVLEVALELGATPYQVALACLAAPAETFSTIPMAASAAQARRTGSPSRIARLIRSREAELNAQLGSDAGQEPRGAAERRLEFSAPVRAALRPSSSRPPPPTAMKTGPPVTNAFSTPLTPGVFPLTVTGT